MKTLKFFPLLLILLLICCADQPTTPTLTEAEIEALIDQRVAEELAKMSDDNQDLTPQEIAEIALKSTVYLIVKKWNKNHYSSGFVVDKGLIATCAHNLDGMISGTAEIVLTGNRHSFGNLVILDKKADLAIVEVTGLSAPALSLSNSDKVKIGDPVFVVGNPRTWQGTFAEGIVSGIRPEGTFYIKKKVIQITAPTTFGSSGGPVLNKNGKVIAIHSETNVNGGNLSFGVGVNSLKSLLSTIR